ncbi:hypothetical protein D3C72_2397240 [compost metagenome]
MPVAATLLLMTQAQGSIWARRRSFCRAAAWLTGVISGSVTMTTWVMSASCRRISGVMMCLEFALPSYCCVICRW